MLLRSTTIACTVAFALAAHAAAQGTTAPRPSTTRALASSAFPLITPRGDPSVKVDSILKLAVNPKDYPDESVALLLDDGVIRLDADGRGSKTYRQVVQILKPGAVEQYQEQRFSYAPKHEKLTVNWIRVLKPNGEVISSTPSHVQDSDTPAQMGDPVYSDRKVRRMSLTGVAEGTIIDYSYTTEELKPFLPGDFFLPWSVSTGARVGRSRYILDVPASLPIRIREENLNFPRQVVESNGRKTYIWAARDLPKIKPEPLAATDSNGVLMSVTISAPMTWPQIGKWFTDIAKGRFALGPVAEAKFREIVSGAKTHDDSIRAVHRWVAQDIRYVSIALGMGGYIPRSPDEVVRTGFGDCKDKATLFIAAMSKMGVTAYPVILNSSGGVKRDLPSIEQLDHMIAAVQTDHGLQFVDLTANLTPYGELPYSEQNEFGYVIHPDGSGEEVTFPIVAIEANRSETIIRGALATDGTFSGWYEERGTGTSQYSLREAFENPLDSAARADAANNIARKLFDNAEGDSLSGSNGKDLQAAPVMRFRIRNGKAAQMMGGTMLLQVPLANMSVMTAAARELEVATPRKFPIDPERFFGYRTSRVELRVMLPAGWKAKLPAGVKAESEFGSFESSYAQVGNELVITRSTRGARGRRAPDKVAAMSAWMRDMAKDDAKMIVLEKGA
ncbi:MAG: hypothetical protein JWO05_1456 [Gemmatimonadetes bacterium]|nr:hypothetical protein [Gemmatimonadota bacterium]